MSRHRTNPDPQSGSLAWRQELLFHVALWLLTAAFFGTFFNRFAGLRSGNGEFSGGIALLRGYLPYKDYFTAGPPLNVLKSALVLHVLGSKLLMTRIVSLGERLFLASILMCWLRQIVPVQLAFVASFVAITLSAGDRADPIASYNHDALLLALSAGLLASVALRKQVGGAGFLLCSLGAGMCAALSLLTKQTVGGTVLLTLAVVPAAFLRRRGTRPTLMWLGTYSAGALLPLVVVGGVLARLHTLRAALTMLFVTGPSAKASHPGEFLIRWGLVAFDNAGWVVLGTFWWVLAWVSVRRACTMNGEDSRASVSRNWLLATMALVLSLIAVAEGLSRQPALHDLTKSVIYATVFCLAGVLVWTVPQSLRSGAPLRTERIVFLAAVSLTTAFALSLSWPAFEAMLLPGVGLMAALLLDGVSSRWRPWAYGVLAFLVFMQLREKLNVPFAFSHQAEAPVYEATERSSLPALQGLRLPGSTVRLLDGTTELIRSHTCRGDAVFTYPEMGLLYTLADRWPPTWSPSHNIDVVNDALAKEDAARVRSARPLVLVTYRETEDQSKAAERLWRQGHPSGQREMAAAVEELERTYQFAGRYVLREGDPPIEVYLRPDATVARARTCEAGTARQ